MGKVIANCGKMYDFAGQEWMCLKCEDGFAPSGDQLACLPSNCLVPDCNSCPNTSICVTCRQGYALAQNRCQRISCSTPNCLFCDAAQSCLKCFSNSTLSSGKCTLSSSCPLPNCLRCKPTSPFCDACSEGYVLNIWSGLCERLPYPIANCSAFSKDPSNQYRCVQCAGALIPSSDLFSCI